MAACSGRCISIWRRRKTGIKPIIGCEVYVAPTSHTDRKSAQAKTRYHLVLLAQNNVGYHNLIKLVSASYLEGFYHKPRVDKALLAQFNEGLIALSACLQGEIPARLLSQGMDAGLAAAREYAELFPGRLYVEIQANGLPEQAVANEKLVELAQAAGLPLVATNDCHYLTAEDAEAHDALLCIQTAARVDDPGRMRFETRELYYKSTEEMEEAFGHLPEALLNTVRIADSCELELDLGAPHFPVYTLPEGKTVRDELLRLSPGRPWSNASPRPLMPWTRPPTRQRLEMELEVISQMGFEGYFLIVQDFINWAKRQGIPVGPGRGSGRRLPGGLGSRHHQSRPHPLRPAFRTVPEQRTDQPPRHRRGLLRTPPRRSHPLRHRALRARLRGPDHHLRHHEGQGGCPRRGPDAGDELRRDGTVSPSSSPKT